MSYVPNHPIQPYVHEDDVKNGKLVQGAKVFIKNKELPADPLWTHLVVFEVGRRVLAVVPLDREHNRTRAFTREAAVLQNVRASLIHRRPGPLDPGPPTDDDSTPLGNGNGCTPIIAASTDP